MIRRTSLFKTALLILMAIIFYLLVIFVTNNIIENQQKNYLQQEAKNYHLVARDPDTLQQWIGNVDLTVIDHPLRQGSDLQNTARDLVSHNLVSKSHPFSKQTINNKTYLAYAYYGRQTMPTVLFVPKNNIWRLVPTTFWLLTVLYFVTIASLLAWGHQRSRKLRQDLDTLVSNVHRIRHRDAPEPLILDVADVLYPLSSEVNKLDEDVSHLNDKIALRNETFKRLIDNLPLGVMLLDEDGNVVLLNQSMRGLLEIEDEPLPHPFIDDVKTYRLSQMIEHTIRDNKNHHGEIQLVQQRPRYVDANVIQLGQEGPRPQILVLLYDLTDIRRIEQMQLDFVGNVSHELKTPVTAIRGFAETLLNKPDADPKDQADFLKIIYSESVRLNQLIQDILELSRLDEDAPDKRTEINVKDSVSHIVSELKPAIKSRELQVDLNGPDDITLAMDPTQFDQIMKNLISNAIFYNKQKGKIAVNFASGTDDIHISVADTGIGLKEDEQDRIFERFYRVDKARSYNNGGTGLGLAIVKEIVENHGGNVSISSQYGVGTTISVKLPKA
ncbi:two-component system histidine kinase PnpS [Agrilactobacillus fermenti]|uniref:two-component system histidine kinase PnpS n=1 Tax=Agrilactobacillus fermenti TaxID=2586909 RepID=UPI001E531550|nr:ATP-binding protein [Agrilactobacillus fermenti]MCD2257218.1 PAS domain-containing protein [Agrilactobacillus fermenti]